MGKRKRSKRVLQFSHQWHSISLHHILMKNFCLSQSGCRCLSRQKIFYFLLTATAIFVVLLIYSGRMTAVKLKTPREDLHLNLTAMMFTDFMGKIQKDSSRRPTLVTATTHFTTRQPSHQPYDSSLKRAASVSDDNSKSVTYLPFVSHATVEESTDTSVYSHATVKKIIGNSVYHDTADKSTGISVYNSTAEERPGFHEAASQARLSTETFPPKRKTLPLNPAVSMTQALSSFLKTSSSTLLTTSLKVKAVEPTSLESAANVPVRTPASKRIAIAGPNPEAETTVINPTPPNVGNVQQHSTSRQEKIVTMSEASQEGYIVAEHNAVSADQKTPSKIAARQFTRAIKRDAALKEAIQATEQKQKVWRLLKQFCTAAESRPEIDMSADKQCRHGMLKHVFFLKVHKAASTTVMNMLYRLALKHGLNVRLPLRGNVFSESDKLWLTNAAKTPAPGHGHFDIMCNHLVFHEDSVRSGLPRDTKFVAIVREPFSQFLSAFLYYRNQFHVHYLSQIKGEDPVSEYLLRPKEWEANISFTRNRMSFDFGMEPGGMEDAAAVARYIAYLDSTFHLVMVSERFDESVVLLKRLMGWRLHDVLYMRSNVHAGRHSQDGHRHGSPEQPLQPTQQVFNESRYTAEQKGVHRDFNAADYALYRHFAHVFQTRVEAEGPLFQQEVQTFVYLRQQVEEYCLWRLERVENQIPGGLNRDDLRQYHQQGIRSYQLTHLSSDVLTLAATQWNEEITVSLTDCLLMTLPEPPFVDLMRLRQHHCHYVHC